MNLLVQICLYFNLSKLFNIRALSFFLADLWELHYIHLFWLHQSVKLFFIWIFTNSKWITGFKTLKCCSSNLLFTIIPPLEMEILTKRHYSDLRKRDSMWKSLNLLTFFWSEVELFKSILNTLNSVKYWVFTKFYLYFLKWWNIRIIYSILFFVSFIWSFVKLIIFRVF